MKCMPTRPHPTSLGVASPFSQNPLVPLGRYDNKPSLFRFLKARNYELDKAVLMYRNHMLWRKENELYENIPTPDGPVPELLHTFVFPEIAHIKENYPFTPHSTLRPAAGRA